MTATLLLSGTHTNLFVSLIVLFKTLAWPFSLIFASGLLEGVRSGKVPLYRMPTPSAMGSCLCGGHTYLNQHLPLVWQGTSLSFFFFWHLSLLLWFFWITYWVVVFIIILACRHNTYLQECTGQREPTYQLNIHDTKLLFLRFAMEQSFSVDTGGGGRESNIHLIPYIIHTVLYVLNTYAFGIGMHRTILSWHQAPFLL